MAKDVAARFARTALEQRSAPYRWLAKHHDPIAQELAKQRRRPWSALAATAAASGITCTPDTLRKAWQRLEADIEFSRARGANPGTPSPTTITASQPPVPPIRPPVVTELPDPATPRSGLVKKKNPYNFQPVSLLKKEIPNE